MPSYGQKQKPAGKKIKCGKPIVGTRNMVSNNMTIVPTLNRIDNIPYKGNPALLAQR
jgi:hypothetical protein|tara:strand:- start:265 stop:435 length:171 start_codon:yes stop_codon:yes gene_type:complete